MKLKIIENFDETVMVL